MKIIERKSSLMTACLLLFAISFGSAKIFAQDLLVPMDVRQSNHLKAYGVAFWSLERSVDVDWLLNYRGGSFILTAFPGMEQELKLRNVYYEKLSGSETATILAQVESDAENMSVVKLEKAPKIGVYAPKQTLPWDDAVLLALTYAEVPYEMIYDDEILMGDLSEIDWLHMHHEDFSGQYGKFYAGFRNHPWYIEQQRLAEASSRKYGHDKVSRLKLSVASTIKEFVFGGGFLFAMCSGTDTFDLALAAHNTDIAPSPFDGDAVDPAATSKLDFDNTLAFRDFEPVYNAMEYEHSDIDYTTPAALRNPAIDYFTLFEFSAKWDPVPSMLTQNHVGTVRGFMGQTTSFRKRTVKPGVVVMAESPGRETVKYLHGLWGQGTFTFYAGHDPEDYTHMVGDPPTDLALHKNSPGYRLILNNVLFPAAKKKKQKT